MTIAELAKSAMQEEARKALEAFSRGDLALYDLHRLNARRLATALGLSALPQRQEVAA